MLWHKHQLTLIFPSLLAIYVFLTVSNHLRIDNVVGISELLFCAILAIYVVHAFKKIKYYPDFIKVFVFLGLCLFISGLLGYWKASIDGVEGHLVGYNTVAMCYMFVVVLVFLGMSENNLSIFYKVLSVTALLISSLVLIVGSYYPDFLPFDINHRSGRFSGLSYNSNQLALLLLPIPVFALYFFGISKYFVEVTLLSLLLAVFTGSDALFLSWLVFFVLAGALFLYFKQRPLFFLASITGLILLMLVCFYFRVELLDLWLAFSQKQDQVSIRFSLWLNALEVLKDSSFMGYGPGSFSGIDAPYQRFEAHNVLLDLSMSYGLLGLFAYLTFIAFIFIRTIKTRSPVLIAAFFSFIFFSLFHYTLRQPLYWIILTSVYLLSHQMLAEKINGSIKIKTKFNS